jgi:Protein of unknown function (DUF3828)
MRFARTIAICLGLTGLMACDMIGAEANVAANATNAATAAPAQPAGAPPSLSAPAPRPEPDLEGARVLIGQLYMPYTRGEIPRTGNVYTPELRAAIARQSDDETGLGYDPFCQCQDFGEFSYAIQSVEREEGGARARIGIDNFGEARVIALRLAYRNGAWLVADIGEGAESLLNGR